VEVGQGRPLRSLENTLADLAERMIRRRLARAYPTDFLGPLAAQSCSRPTAH